MLVDSQPGITFTTFRAHMLVDSPGNFPFPVLYFPTSPDILALTGVSSVSWLTLPIVGLHPAGLQGLCLPSFKTEERVWSQHQRYQWFNGWGNLHVWSKVLEQHPTMCRTRWAGHGRGLCSSFPWIDTNKFVYFLIIQTYIFASNQNTWFNKHIKDLMTSPSLVSSKSLHVDVGVLSSIMSSLVELKDGPLDSAFHLSQSSL